MSILSALRQQRGSIDDLAKLPQAMIMQMAQKREIAPEMVAPILSRKAEMMEAVARSKSLQNAGQMPPTVMEQLMAKNVAAENPQSMQQPMQQPMAMDNVGVAQLPIPEREYAGGGIVAFAKGSMIDLDDDEIDPFDDYAKATAAIQRTNAMPVVNMPTAKQSIFSQILPQSYESALAEKGQTPASVRKMMIEGPKKGDYVAPPEERRPRGNHPLESKALEAANRVGLDPNLMLHALYKETGGSKDPATAMSKAGAYGPMQLMASTAKELGVDRKDVDQNIYGGALYLKQMFDKYQDPTLALAAYNAGPGRVDKALRSSQGIASLPRETQNYIVASNRMAGGGEIQHFIKGDLVMGDFGEARRASLPSGSLGNVVDDFGNLVEEKGKKIKTPPKIGAYGKIMGRLPYLGAALTAAEGIDALVESDTGTASEFLDPIAAMQGTQGGYERKIKPNIYKQMAENIKKENTSDPITALYNPPINYGADSEDASTGAAMRQTYNANKTESKTPAEIKSELQMYLEQDAADRKALAQQRSEDKNMALLAAGLGMLGGESPYAFANIGKGGLSGVSYLADANKQRAAEKAALDRNKVAAMHYGNIGDYYKSQTLSREEKAVLAQQKLAETKIQSARDDYKQFSELVGKGFKDKYPMAALNLEDPKNAKLYQDYMAQYAPVLQNLLTIGYPNLPPMGEPQIGTRSLAQQAAAEKAKREANK